MEETNNTCSICLQQLDIHDKSIIQVQCCNNQFHTSCYLDFMKEKPICPLCRTSYNIHTSLQSQISSQLPETTVNIHMNNSTELQNHLQHQYQMRRCKIMSVVILSSLFPFYLLFTMYAKNNT